ncbi:MAG: hypothetical protein Pg6A_14770 [Termitinemataceae bacterium]|nr:MAG: hypothetical protein Pg6A_14770 [Termitinemataceae bacterium]
MFTMQRLKFAALCLVFLSACDDLPPPAPIDPNFGTDRFDSRKRETALGDMVCDGMVWYFNNNLPPDNKAAAFGVINGGIFEAGLPKAHISPDMPLGVLKADVLSYIDIPGSEVKRFFEELAAIRIGDNAWAQVSREVEFTINWTNGMGQVRGLKIEGQEVDDAAVYRIVTGDVLIWGKENSLVDRFWTTLNQNMDSACKLETIVPVAVSQYVASRTAPYIPQIDGRIVIEKENR